MPPAFCKGTPAVCATYGNAGQYEQIACRAFGELDPADPLNDIIQDIALAKDPDGKVRYVASFVITKPLDMSKASGLILRNESLAVCPRFLLCRPLDQEEPPLAVRSPRSALARIHRSLLGCQSFAGSNVALSRALQRVGCSSGLCRSLKMIFPSREDQHGGMALEGSREHLCALHTQANTVVLDR